MYAAPFDTVIVSLSKGLGAPAGSLLAGSREHLQSARRFRKIFGGGMRQVGILAAAGLYALHHHRPFLAQNHARARRLAEAIAALPAFHLNLATVETNIVVFDVVRGEATSVLTAMQEEGILMVALGLKTIRATTHRDVSDDDIDIVLRVFHKHYGKGIPA